ncbi:flagellar biosynthetic protein FliR [Kerstersia gyiorum]|jgi:flagellar biosynthetic protein FliR|uniref:flagellar biosynthetic protein FliR n=1 Tax=Kerstersia gyiorum TaxID=206506 RepID=UPI0024302859|nr:flagellar biosynthetic protein FliR [Kerstersia gyiorum]MCH4271233.1 flagellar biosynthetic protein FliR [Kerstersia gyiorum]MCI1227993.1 flagellar biosynthetic protein FliR [Kerstersia gyiorum]
MIALTLDQLYGWIHAFILPFARIGALMLTAPVLGDAAIPKKIKLAIALALTLALAPAAGPIPDIPPGSWPSLSIIARQLLIGLAMGLCMRVVFAAVHTAGEFVGLQMGLSFATFFDPGAGASTTVLSRLFNAIAVLLFLALDGHLLMIAGLQRSFESLPLAAPLDFSGWGVLLEWSSAIIVSGLLMALPLITALLTINLALGILNRTAPQMSVFAVGFPVSLIAGLLALLVVLPNSSGFLGNLIQDGLENMLRLVQALAGG